MSRAVQLDGYGDIDMLKVREVPVRAPGPDEVVVEVRAAGINPGEAAIRKGLRPSDEPPTFPMGEGSDLASVVAEVGASVTSVAVGDEVMGWSWERSSHAERCVVPAAQLIPKPATLSWEVAGSLYVVGVTSYAAVRAVAVGPGDTVAVSAAAGGVGVVTVQLLMARGAQVLAIASEGNHDWLRNKGATPVTYGPGGARPGGDGLADRLRAAAPQGIDAFIDLFGPEYVHLAVELGIARDRIETIISFAAAEELGTKAEGSVTATTPEILSEMADLVASGQIEVPIAATYPLEEVRAAYAELDRRHTRGKIVLIP